MYTKCTPYKCVVRNTKEHRWGVRPPCNLKIKEHQAWLLMQVCRGVSKVWGFVHQSSCDVV